MPPKKKPVAPAPAATVVETPPAFTPAEAKKLAKLLKAADRGKRLDAIRTVSENHEYIASGGCLLPLLESTVAKKKMEDVVKAAGQVIVDYLIGRDNAADATVASENTLAAMEEAKKKPGKYKLAEVMGNLMLNPDRENSWNAVRSLRSMAAVVASLPKDSVQAFSCGALLLGSGQPVERLCSFFMEQEKLRLKEVASDGGAKNSYEGSGPINTVPWTVLRLYVMDTLGVMCGISSDAVQTVVARGAVPFLLGVLRWITASDAPDLPLLTSTLVVLFAVAKAGSGAAATRGSAAPTATAPLAGGPPPELAALADGGAWGAVYDALKGPIMARAAQLQSGVVVNGSGKKQADASSAVSPDLASCLDNMARCAEVLRVMAMTGAGLEQEGALEAGVAAMSSVLGMQGLPREEEAVANLMTGMVKAMGSIACLSEGNRIKICSAGAAPMVLALMAPPNFAATDATAVGSDYLRADTPHGRLMRKTAEKCLHHLLVSRVTWMADDRALCDTFLEAEMKPNAATNDGEDKTASGAPAAPGTSAKHANAGEEPCPAAVALGPAYLTVDAVLAAANADSIDVRCRAIRLLSRLVSSRRNAAALGAAAVPSLGRLVAWWLRTKNDPEAHRTPRSLDATVLEGKSTAAGGAEKKASAAKASGGAPKDEPAFVGEEHLEAARLTIKRLEDADGTRVLRDEALAYALGVLLQLADTGEDERAAIGADMLVDLLAQVLKGLPCTPEEFYVNVKSGVLAEEDEDATSALGVDSVPRALVSGSPGDRVAGYGGEDNHAPVPVTDGNFDEGYHPVATGLIDRPDTSLDLRATGSNGTTRRHIFCWRGDKSHDLEVALFSPLDWGWEFAVSPSQEPVQPGLVLRAAVLRVLTTVVDGYTPSADSLAASPSVPMPTGKSGAAAAATATAGSAAAGSTDSGEEGSCSILKHTLPVCLDLLSVDVRHGTVTDDVGVDGDQDVGNSPVMSREVVTPDALSGTPVSPAEELVHEDIRLGCLRLVASLLRLGGVTREGLIFVADTNRNGWRKMLAALAGRFSETTMPENSDTRTRPGDTITGKNASGGELWAKPETFCSWDFQRGEYSSLLSALPYVRAVSALLTPLSNPDAPSTHVMTALVALRRLCEEGELEPGGAQPEESAADEPPLPSTRSGTTQALTDTLAGVAVGLGALVPLMSIWGSAVAAAGEGTLPVETAGMVDECQTLINYLIERGHSREAFWASLPSVDNTDDKVSAAARSQKKTQLKSKGSAKRSKGGSKDEHDPAAALGAVTEGGVGQDPRSPPLGRPDPNLGPDRATWARLLNARVDDHRTHSSDKTALLMATATGLETAVHSLLVVGADPNVRGSDGRTPLMYALAQGMDEAVRKLVKAGGDVDAADLHGSTVLKAAFLSPPRQTMRNIMRRSSEAGAPTTPATAAAAAAAVVLGRLPPSSATTRRCSTTRTNDSSLDSSTAGRPRSRSRSGSFSISRTRTRTGSLATGRRRSSLNRAVSFNAGVPGESAASGWSDRRGFFRSSSMSATDSARAAFRAGRRESVGPLKTPRGTIVVEGDARMVPYILACGADPNVSSGTGDFPLHWAVTGTDLTVRIMDQHMRIVAGGRIKRETEAKTNAGLTVGGGKEIRAYKGQESSPSPVGDLALLEVLVKSGSSLDACNLDGITALHAAVIADRADLAGALLDSGASPNVSDSLGCLPLHYACLRASRGYEELTSRLLSLGMGRPLVTGVHRDLRKGRTRREKLLLDVSEIMRSGLGEATAPSSITQHRATRTELLNHVSAEGLAPLHYLCDGRVVDRGPASAILARSQRCLLPSPCAPPRFYAPAFFAPAVTTGHTPQSTDTTQLIDSSSSERIQILRQLLSEEELDPRVRAPHGATTLHLASQVPGSQGADLLRMLVQTGVNLDALDVPTADNVRSGRCPDTAPWFSSPACGHARFNSSVVVGETEMDRGHGVLPCSSDNGVRDTPVRFSALHYALRAGSWETAEVLLSAGASVQAEGAFPPCLHVACHAGAPASLVTRLLDGDERETANGIDKTTTAAKMWGVLGPTNAGAGPYAPTPLFLAAAVGSVELVSLLLPLYSATQIRIHSENCSGDYGGGSRGGGGSIVTEDVWSMKHGLAGGRNPLHATAIGGHTSTARALLDAGAAKAWLNATDAMSRTPLDLAVAWGKWEVATVIASAEEFDMRLAMNGGASCALLSVERANIAIVDEGSGEASALSALRASNALIMALLKRLHTVDRDAATAAVTATSTVKDGGQRVDIAPDTDDKAKNETGVVSRPGEIGGEGRDESREEGGMRKGNITPFQLPIIHHLHPCFAEGVLYSNAKGVFIPDTPGRQRRSSSLLGFEAPTPPLRGEGESQG